MYDIKNYRNQKYCIDRSVTTAAADAAVKGHPLTHGPERAAQNVLERSTLAVVCFSERCIRCHDVRPSVCLYVWDARVHCDRALHV